jgi:Ser/Thr protein kinase RdoA (MazF antagonist)
MNQKQGAMVGERGDVWPIGALAPYGLTPPLHVVPLAAGAGINNQVRVVRTGAGQFLWKHLTHADPAHILAEHGLLGWLAGANLPFGTPQPLATAAGATLLPAPGGGRYALFRWLPGEPLARRDPATIAALGAALGLLHGALAALPVDLCPAWTTHGALAAIHPRVPDPATLTPHDLGLPDAAPQRDALARWRTIVAELGPFLTGTYPTLPRQAIHGDFGPGNALAGGTRITAILDFEFALDDARALDLAAGLEMIVRREELSLPEALALGGALCAGYARTARLLPAELAALPQLILLREIVGAIWWLGRALVAGDPTPWFARLENVLLFRAWFGTYERPLLAAIASAIAQG